jgi:hypothetical protein
MREGRSASGRSMTLKCMPENMQLSGLLRIAPFFRKIQIGESLTLAPLWEFTPPQWVISRNRCGSDAGCSPA